MIVTQSDVLATSLAAATWLTIRESNTYNRVLSFKNLTNSTLSIKIQTSADGGATWTDHVNTFELAIGEMIAKVATATGLLRVVGSGETNTRGILVSYTRYYLDSLAVWQAPVV